MGDFGDFKHPPCDGVHHPPFSLRLSFEERAVLEKDAGGKPLGAYIRQQLFESSPSAGPGGNGFKYKPRRKRTKTQRPVKDHKALGQLLGALGEARLSNNLNQLAKAVHTGSLPVTPEVENQIHEAYEEIIWMRKKLIDVLGLKPE